MLLKMKSALLVSLFSQLVSIIFAISKGLYVCNQSGESIKVAYAYYKDSVWHSRGWTTIADEDCSQMTATFTDSRYYVYAFSDSSDKKWEADHKFCVNPKQDFEIDDAGDTKSCETKKFFSVWIPYLAEPVFPEHYEVVIGPNTFGLNSARAER